MPWKVGGGADLIFRAVAGYFDQYAGQQMLISNLEGKASYEAHGFGEEYKHHQGGPIGYVPRDCRVGFENDVTIRENQAFCWNPSITGTKSEDTMIATSKGPQLVTHPVLFPTVKVEAEGMTFERTGVLAL